MEDTERTHRLWVAAAAGLVLLAIAVRLSINFADSYPPGVNAAYYPLQVRTWLTQGRLMYDDLPLIFWLNAAFSKVLVAALGLRLDDAVLIASRILDSVIQPCAAAIIMMLGYIWSDGRRSAIVGCTAAASLSVLSPPVMRMLSEFEKNSLGLVIMAAAVWSCRSAMVKRSGGAWALFVAVLGLAALTHLGAFAVTLTMTVSALAVWCWLSLRPRMFAIGFALFGGSSAVLIAVLGHFDPHRAARLIRAPIELFRTGPNDSLPIPILVVAALLIAVAIGLLWRDREDLFAADVAIVVSAALTIALLACPKSFVYFDRLILMLPLPASVLLAFIMARLQKTSRLAGFSLLILSLFAAVSAPEAVQRPLMNRGVAAELLNIKQQIPQPGSTLVIAPHGLEWWAGFFLGTPVRSALSDAMPGRYHRVLLLRNTIDCPPEVVPPFGIPPVNPSAVRIYLGHYVEVYETN